LRKQKAAAAGVKADLTAPKAAPKAATQQTQQTRNPTVRGQ
jgi:hypothetical protein